MKEMTPKKTLISATIWITGLVLCVVFVGVLLPYSRARGRYWKLPLDFRTELFIAGGCCLILMITYLANKYWSNGGKSN